MPQHSKDKLADALDAAGLSAMAAKARQGYYHDFLSPLATPCLQLAADLTNVGTPVADALRGRHLRGEFDATAEESPDWRDSSEGKVSFNALFTGIQRHDND